MLGDFASLDVQNTYRGSDAYDLFQTGHAWWRYYSANKENIPRPCSRRCSAAKKKSPVTIISTPTLTPTVYMQRSRGRFGFLAERSCERPLGL
ncbi:hypothetical protein [Piscirickettsia salmonis]|uniref:hypothetical protein n=1 Tax=Piscirickettsia salmonis TaxID=1238 RepID=UPI0012D38030|nr:hypothetical protein [Piscirickettsia salmonis]